MFTLQNKIISSVIGGLILIFGLWYAVTLQKVPAGYRGVIVNLYGTEKGVAEQSVGVGRYHVGFNKELYQFPTFLQNYTWTKSERLDESITTQTSEGLSIGADVGITYSILPENVVKVFQKYRLGIDEITHTFLHNMTRDAMNKIASTMTVEEIYGTRKEEFIQKVTSLVQKEAEEDGIDVQKVYLIGSFRLPDSVIESINMKIQATQNALKVENEVATTKAEAQKTIVEAQAQAQQMMIKAKAEADANLLVSRSLTPEFIQYNALQKWDGKLPTMMTGNAVPFINIGKKND
jgi:regulator of protease activity HflC (stomatin/prohibitin superfamily)